MSLRIAAILTFPLALGSMLASPASAQARTKATAAKFAAPVRLKAGDAFMGDKRLYPSPVFQDVNGDKLPDVVIGDLWGKLTVALRVAGDGIPSYAAETFLQGADGKDLNFANW